MLEWTRPAYRTYSSWEWDRFLRMQMTETEIPLSDVPDDPSEGTLPEDAPLTDDPEPGQAGGETDPEAETKSGTEPTEEV